MTLAARMWIAAAAVTLTACSMGWDMPSPEASDAGAGAPGGDASTGATAQAGAEGGVSSPSTGDASVACGPNMPCAAGLVCHYADHLCGEGTSVGRCVAPATNCIATPKVCGCDGAIYDDTCTANRAAQDVSVRGNCTAPPTSGDYLCGYVFCWFPGILPAQYCRQHTSGAETTFDCPFAPPTCDSHTCIDCSMSGCGTCKTLLGGGWMFDCP
jgi:hypothetical protein